MNWAKYYLKVFGFIKVVLECIATFREHLRTALDGVIEIVYSAQIIVSILIASGRSHKGKSFSPVTPFPPVLIMATAEERIHTL